MVINSHVMRKFGLGLSALIYIIIAVLVIAALINFALWLLPYALIAFAVFWLYKKLFGVKGKRDDVKEDRFQGNSINRNNTESRDESSKKVIDVDYEEVDD